MLSVKQNVSKNYANGLLVLATCFLSASAMAKPISPMTGPSIINMLVSLGVVVAVILLFAFVAKKLKIGPANQQGIKLVANLPIGQKERVVVIEVENEQYLLGVTASQINLLQKLPTNIQQSPSTESIGELPFDLMSVLKKGKS